MFSQVVVLSSGIIFLNSNFFIEGTVLRCTALANVGHMSGAHYPLEDDNGECVSCSLYNIVPRGQKKANNFFGKGILMI
jgi:hypothetical protein